MGLIFEVAEGGFLDIDVKIYGPDEKIIHQECRKFFFLKPVALDQGCIFSILPIFYIFFDGGNMKVKKEEFGEIGVKYNSGKIHT